MGTNIVLAGMVLQALPIGEYDKRVTILTKERGKIAAFARGVRRPGNMMMAATNPFAFGEFELYQGRSTYNVTRTSVSNYFRDLASDYDTACYGFYFLEMAEYFSMENENGADLLNLLYLSLRALEKGTIGSRLVRAVFEWRMLLLNGTYPNVFTCLSCGGKEAFLMFDTAEAGMVCAKCAGKEKDFRGIRLSPSAVYAMQYILSSPLEKLFTFTVSEKVLAELERTASVFYGAYINHRFKSQAFLPPGIS
ncbi:MAG: DNA repair protein RecO [Eubacterium sp.]|nr:DNA repair protein RecO [Eubacterium sp.]